MAHRYHCPNCDQIVTRPHLCPALTQPAKEPKDANRQANPPAEQQRAAGEPEDYDSCWSKQKWNG